MTQIFNSKHQKIAKRYASALSKFDERDTILKELEETSEILAQSKDLADFLVNPIITLSDKKDVLEKVFADFSQNTKNFLKLLVDKNRFDSFNTILELFKEELDELHNIKRVEIISAVDLLDEEKARLKDKLQVKLSAEVAPEYKIDNSIIAGLVIKIGDKVIDNSVKAGLDGLKKQLL